MVWLKIAVLDTEEMFLEQLRAYLVRKKEMFFKIWTFTNEKDFLEKSEKCETFDAVVMTAFFWEKLSGSQLQPKRILLCEGEREAKLADCPFVIKYQPAEALLRQISAMLWKKSKGEEECLPEKVAELIGVYSPVHHESQILFSMTMAQILGEEKKTLYVNLMAHSGFYQLTNADDSEDVGDLVYGMMQNEYDFAAGLHRVRQTYQNFDFIPPAVNPEHIAEISKTLPQSLFSALKTHSGYDVVIIDFDRVFSGFTKILPAFSGFYCLGKEGTVNRYRMEEFFAYLEKEDAYDMAHINRLSLPAASFFEGNLLENSLYGGMGDCIRRCLYGGVKVG